MTAPSNFPNTLTDSTVDPDNDVLGIDDLSAGESKGITPTNAVRGAVQNGTGVLALIQSLLTLAASAISNDSSVVGATVDSALDQLDTDLSALGTDDIANDSAVPGLDATAALDDLNTTKVDLAGQLGGTVASPDVRGLRTTEGGGTLLTLGSVADGDYLRRSGTDIVGGTPAGGGGDAISVNGTGVTDADLDDALPAAPAGAVNVTWQTSGSGPANVSASVQGATTTQKGVAELATQAEVDAGSDAERIVTPSTLANSSHLAQATTGALGRVELATQAEVAAGSDTQRAVTPATLAGRSLSGMGLTENNLLIGNGSDQATEIGQYAGPIAMGPPWVHRTTSDPDETDDGYAPGWRWHNTSNGKIWECVSNGVGAAVWRCVNTVVVTDAATGTITPNNTYDGSVIRSTGVTASRTIQVPNGLNNGLSFEVVAEAANQALTVTMPSGTVRFPPDFQATTKQQWSSVVITILDTNECLVRGHLQAAA